VQWLRQPVSFARSTLYTIQRRCSKTERRPALSRIWGKLTDKSGLESGKGSRREHAASLSVTKTVSSESKSELLEVFSLRGRAPVVNSVGIVDRELAIGLSTSAWLVCRSYCVRDHVQWTATVRQDQCRQRWVSDFCVAPYTIHVYAIASPPMGHWCTFPISTANSLIIMAALCNRAGHYIFALWFLSSIYLSFFIPRLISAATDWMSTIILHMAWP